MKVETGQELLAIISEGSKASFTEFYTHFFQRLLLTAEKYVGNVHVAEEIVQNTFLKIWENPAQLEDVKSLKSYLYKAVVNSSINHINREKNIAQHHQIIASKLTEEDVAILDEEQELVALLYQEIEKLPPQCRKVFKMSRFDRLKYKEIATLLNLSEKTVENHIATAIKQLRKVMTNKNIVFRSSKGKMLVHILFF